MPPGTLDIEVHEECTSLQPTAQGLQDNSWVKIHQHIRSPYTQYPLTVKTSRLLKMNPLVYVAITPLCT
jgi:hypothetical protein